MIARQLARQGCILAHANISRGPRRILVLAADRLVGRQRVGDAEGDGRIHAGRRAVLDDLAHFPLRERAERWSGERDDREECSWDVHGR